jgi:hypothetical protein
MGVHCSIVTHHLTLQAFKPTENHHHHHRKAIHLDWRKFASNSTLKKTKRTQGKEQV